MLRNSCIHLWVCEVAGLVFQSLWSLLGGSTKGFPHLKKPEASFPLPSLTQGFLFPAQALPISTPVPLRLRVGRGCWKIKPPGSSGGAGRCHTLLGPIRTWFLSCHTSSSETMGQRGKNYHGKCLQGYALAGLWTALYFERTLYSHWYEQSLWEAEPGAGS